MNITEQWFTNAESGGLKKFHHQGVDFIIYKGFKLSKNTDTYTIEDVRRSDFYDEVKSTDHAKLIKLGFIKGENIHKNIDLLFLYKTRINQYNLKYNINKE